MIRKIMKPATVIFALLGLVVVVASVARTMAGNGTFIDNMKAVISFK